MYGADFFEGVRCTLIDRNDTPKFSHASVADVKSDDYLSFFEKLPQNEELSLWKMQAEIRSMNYNSLNTRNVIILLYLYIEINS